MKKLNKKRIAILIFLVIVVLFEIIAFRDSRANKIIEVTLATIDNSGFLSVEQINMSAINGEESGYYIFLPEYINEKRVIKYIIEQKNIQSENIEDENVENENIEVNEMISTTIKEEFVEKIPNSKIFLTNEEVKNKIIHITVEYDDVERNEQRYYYKQIEEKINNHIIKIKGYMPLDAKVKVTEAKQEEVDKIKQEYENAKVTFKVAYDIKIISGDKEYEPSEIDENVEVSISGIEELSDKAQKHKVIHVKEEQLEEINEVITKKDEVSFETDSFSTYAILLDNSEIIEAGTATYDTGNTILSDEASIWDGTIADNFQFGNGSQNNPYLISRASELAYLARQVNYGNTYENNYFQLVRDIDLDAREWTPIGTTQQSFRGIFDGAGHIITNANITIPSNMPTYQADSYGIFGSIGGNDNSDAIVKDLQISDINIVLNAGGNTNTTWTQRGYHIGIVTGSIYQRGKISNIIVKNSNISDTNVINIQENVFQISVGGIAGYAAQNPWGTSDPGEGKRYSIENCFSNVNINLDITFSSIEYAGQYHSGGIIGTIRSQPVWPVNCLYVGQNNARNGFTGPIFGALINNTSHTSSNNFSIIWNGNDAGNLSLINGYYSIYETNGNALNQTITQGTSTYMINNSSTNIGSVQGINKGSYMNDISQMLSIFNNYSENDVTWNYSNGTYSFIPRIATTVTKKIPVYTVNVLTESTNEHTYRWYINNVEDTQINGNSHIHNINCENDCNVTVLTSDGAYYAVSEFVIPKLSLYIEFIPDYTNHSVSAKISGDSVSYIDLSEYSYQWYKENIAGEELEELEGKTTTNLTDLENLQDYRFVATHNTYEELKIEGSFLYGDRNVIYVNYQSGNDNNDGKTPEKPVKTITRAYNRFTNAENVKSNVIVLIGNYTNNDYISANNNTNRNNFSKRVTLTGKYKGTDYNSGMYFGASDNNVGRTLFADTCIQNMRLYGSTSANGRGSTYFYLQGHSLTIGNEVYFERYNTTQNTNALVDNSPSPDFHIIGGFSNYNQNNLPADNNNGTIIIKSGTYARIISGSRNTQVNNTSHNFTGTKDNPFNMKVIIDIQKSTTASNFKYDVNLLVGGQTDGNVYANTNLEIRNGKLGRILGGSIGYSRTVSRYPSNSFLGSTKIDILGGEIDEVFGGSLGRLQSDVYYYGKIEINISGGTINNTLYGVGAGGVTGYDANSTDPYKSYGQSYDTTATINITGGTVNGNIYGAGYGYSQYLNASQIASDGGAFYGDSYINISGGQINGNIYGAGRGYSGYSGKRDLAQMKGTTNITITGAPTINGNIYGAGEGITNYPNTAKFTGTTNVNINTNLSQKVYGGGNIASTVGDTIININSGNHTGEIYAGGNVGEVTGKASVYIKGGTSSVVYAGGQSSNANTTYAYLQGGHVDTLYGGSNITGTIQNTNIETLSGSVNIIYGGNNVGGNCNRSNIQIKGGNILDSVYGGGNQVYTNTTNITLNSSSNIIPKVFGGGNRAGVNETYIYLEGATAEEVFGGSNQEGTVEKTNIYINNGTINSAFGGNNQGGTTVNSNVTVNGGTTNQVFGGNNQGGTTTSSHVYTKGGSITDVYGGGDKAVTNETYLQINSNILNSVFGGGNEAGVNNNTYVELNNATVENNIYGGGNEGTVGKDTYVNVKDTTCNNNIYAGGNGITATVYGNTNLVMQGTKNIVKNSVFGGGNKAETGTEANNNSISLVNIVGANIGKNVYGGANTSVVYGKTQTNIGYDAVSDTSLERGDIVIKGTVFGGGEANEAGSEVYDFSFISVTDGTNININGNNYDEFEILGSIFGSGNASSSAGDSFININNYGTVEAPKKNISIQRANLATINNSSIALSGATDRTNEYSNTYFTISRVDQIKLKNNSTLYLNCGTNLLKKFSSLVDENGIEQKAEVSINEDTGEVTRNVDNRIYVSEGKNINIATNEQVTAYGEVEGMTFFGLFTNNMNPHTSTGIYNQNYNNKDQVVNAGTFTSNSYIMAQHLNNHDTKVDGFYTNENNNGIIKTTYVETTPEDDVYYIWLVGEKMDVTVFEITLTASKYATLGTYELLLTGFSNPNIKFTLTGFSAGLASNVSLVESDEIPAIANTEEEANSIFGLTMKTGNNGWQTKSSTNLLTASGGTYTGSNLYTSDNSNFTPTLNFCLYHAENLTIEEKLGDVKIRFQALTPIDDLNYKISYIDINVALLTALYQNDFYEAAITPGREFNLFTTTETNITDKSSLSTYYSLYIDNFSESDYIDGYANYKRVLESRDSNNMPYVFPVNTKITMLDKVTNSYYYYVVDNEDIQNQKYLYYLSEFICMGSNNKYFDEKTANEIYHDKEKNLIYENFIFHIDFSESQLTNNIVNNTLLMQLRDNEEQILIGVLGIQRDTMLYSVYPNQDAKIIINAQAEKDSIYLGNDIELKVTTDFNQTITNSKTIYDTQYFDKKMGIKISFYDNNSNRLSGDSLLGITLELDGKKYYPRIDGTTRICIAEKVSNVFSRIKINTQNNKTLATGTYKILIESFGSSDGIYYGLESSDSTEVTLTIINSAYGLKVSTEDDLKIVDSKTGNTQKGNNYYTTKVEYSSGLENPNIAMSLYRRQYSDDVYSQNYELVDLNDYVTTILTETEREKEYVVSSKPVDMSYNYLMFKENLITGTYKLVFKLYDEDTLIGETYEYFIIK